MRIYHWVISVFLLLPCVITAQGANGNDTGALQDTMGGGMDGAGAGGYGTMWWFWSVLLLAVMFIIVWWAVRAGSGKPGQRRS
ncbi:MAG: hypothetical protein LBI42_05615 [Chitinispirillales bacterium]|nr:hypothetical protein [Chitinispirillales bacterium]